MKSLILVQIFGLLFLSSCIGEIYNVELSRANSSSCSAEVESAPFQNGDGSVSSPFGICNASQLNAISDNASYMDKHFVVLQDIDLQSLSFNMIGSSANPFMGNFDGGDFEISNLNLNLSLTDGVGFFSGADSATIKNIKLLDVLIYGQHGTGALAGGVTNTVVDNIFISGNVYGGSDLGGLIGSASNGSQITNAVVELEEISGDSSIGGLVGYLYYASIEDSSAEVDLIDGNGTLGGIVGNAADSFMARVSFKGDIQGSNLLGGIIGSNFNTPLFIASAEADLNGEDFVGGVIGRNQRDFHNHTVDRITYGGRVVGLNNIGGVIGTSDGGVSRAEVTFGYVQGEIRVGGLIGSNSGILSESSVNLNNYVRGNDGVGGAVGHNNGTIREINLIISQVISIEGVGGAVGINDNAIERVNFEGIVSGADRIGGLIGENNGSMTDSTGVVTIDANWDPMIYSGQNIGLLIGLENDGGIYSDDKYLPLGSSATGTGTKNGVPAALDQIGSEPAT